MDGFVWNYFSYEIADFKSDRRMCFIESFLTLSLNCSVLVVAGVVLRDWVDRVGQRRYQTQL